MKTSTIKKIIIYIICLILLYLILSFFISMRGLESQNWLDFSGNILGSLLGVLGAYLILRYQFKVDQKNSEITQIDNTFFNMLDLFQKVQDDVQKKSFTVLDLEIDKNFNHIETDIDVDVFYKILDEIRDNKKKYLAQKKKKYIQNKFEEIDKELKKEINENINEILETMRDIDYTSMEYNQKLSMIAIVDSINEVDLVKFTRAVYELEESIRSRGIEFYEEGELKIKKVLEINSKLKTIQEKYEYPIQEEDVFIIVDKVFSNYHSIIGNYLRVFHRLVKQIISSQLGMEKKKEYLGIIRAILSSDELLIIFYNTFYSTRGKGLREQLIIKDKMNNKTEFFADKADLLNFDINQENGTIDLPFFKYQDLIFIDNDFAHIQELSNEK